MTNIAEILKYAPKGIKLYSLVHGYVTLKKVNITQKYYPIEIIDNTRDDFETLTNDGKIYTENKDAECILFPSKEHKSWDNWQEVLFQYGDVVTSTETKNTFIIIFKNDIGFNGIDKSNICHKLWYKNYRYATPEEREKFFKELNTNGYTWNDNTKQIEKIEQLYTPKYKVGNWINFNDSLCEITNIEDYRYELFYHSTKDKVKIFVNEVDTNSVIATEQELINAGIKEKPFTIDQLKPFDKVLVRDNYDSHWEIELFAQYDTNIQYICLTCAWRYCIPYNDETKHLLGTTDDCPDKYKNW